MKKLLGFGILLAAIATNSLAVNTSFVNGQVLTATQLNGAFGQAVTNGNVTPTTNTVTFSSSGAAALTVPVSGTLSTLAGLEALTNKSLNGITGLILGNGSSVATAFGGAACSNQFVRSLNASGAATCNSVALATDVSGTLQAAQFPALTGDVTTSSGSLATTLATVVTGATNTKITYNAKGLVTAGAAAALASADFANQGTTTTVLHGNASGNPAFTAVDLTADVTNALPLANGGTNATSANAALNNLLPSQTGNNGLFLTTNGTNTSWASAGGGGALSSISAATGANSINNGDNAQTWNWALTTASKSAFKFTENSAATGGSGAQYLVNIGTLASSTANPLQVNAQGNPILTITNVGAVTLQGQDTNTGSAVTIRSGNNTATGANGPNITVSGGNTNGSSSGTQFGGNATLQGGTGGGSGGTGDSGGDAIVQGGAGAPADGGFGGNVKIFGGNANAGVATGSVALVGGYVHIFAGSSTGSNVGPGVTIDGGTGGATGNGGVTLVRGGGSGSTSGTGGALTLMGGTGNGSSSTGGLVTVQGGNGAGVGGNVTLLGGVNSGTGAGSLISLTAGNGSGSNQNGGNVNFTGGTATGSGIPGTIITNSAISDEAYSQQSPSSGFSITISAGVSTLLLTPSGTLATGTITMPSNAHDGQLVRIASSQTITSLTVSANSGQTMSNAPTTLVVSTTAPYGYMFINVGNTWYRLQ